VKKNKLIYINKFISIFGLIILKFKFIINSYNSILNKIIREIFIIKKKTKFLLILIFLI
jgi:hypothetical protein